MATVENIKRHNGIAGQYAYSAIVTYEGEEPSRIELVSSVYGPPIILISPDGHQIPISQRVTDRLGQTLDRKWVEGFFA